MFRRCTVALIAALLLFVSAQSVFAQNRAIGIKGGVTLASADIEDVEGTFDADNRTGWGVGAFLTLGAGPFSIQPELNYLELGFETGLPFVPEVKLRYLAPVILLKLGLPLVVVKPSVFGGVGYGIELGCTIGTFDCEDAQIELETSSSDPTGVFGADLDVFLSETTLLRVDVRYAVGFNDIEEASDIWTEIKNRAWQVQVGLAYRFGR
jgi:hypothetical protein